MSQADRSIGELAGLGHFLPNPHLLAHPFIRQEAVFSSRIEGRRASLSDLYAYESGQLALFELPDDVREVHNYVRALEYGLQRIDHLVETGVLREITGQTRNRVYQADEILSALSEASPQEPLP